MKILFLFGAGISLKSGGPSTQELTQKVLEARLWRHTGGGYYPEDLKTNHLANESIPKFLNLLRIKIAQYLARGTNAVSYEEIAFLASQIDREYGSRRNPAFQDWLKKIEAEFTPRLHRHNTLMTDEPIMAQAHEALAFISSAIAIELRNLITPEGFDWLANVVQHEKIKSHFATLNHDGLLETFFRAKNLPFDDGFYNLGDHDRFDGYKFHKSTERKLIKLHGSIDWRPCGGATGYHVARLREYSAGSNDYVHIEGTQSHPELIIGTFNKMEEYNYGIFPHLFSAFQNLLYSIKAIIICGYGFSDAGVNLRMFDWLASGTRNRMLVIHPDPELLQRECRYHAHTQFGHFLKIGRLHFLRCRFEDTNPDEVLHLIAST